jgi:Ca2+-binding EF-hand superfamily protein
MARTERAGHVADIEAARKAFQRFDLNGDGQITATEYKSVMAQLGDPYVTESIAQAVINAHDANGDGLLSFEEFWAFHGKAQDEVQH